MKKRIVSMVLAVITSGMLTACGSEKTVAEAPVEVVEEQKEVVEEVVAEEPECEHEWIEADYWNAKTCSKCGETEGEPIKAKHADESFAELDTEVDMPMIVTDSNGNTLGTNTAKAWFTNYKVFESDDTHEAKDGYEWRTVEMHLAIGDDTEFDRFSWGADVLYNCDYYEDSIENEEDGTNTITYKGEEYVINAPDVHEIEFKKDTTIPEFADKYGWSGEGASYLVYQYECQVPIGFDGYIVGWADHNDYIAKGEDAIENAVYFRMK